MQVYKCPQNCHIRIHAFWIGDDAEKCPRCGEFMIYKGDKTEEQIQQMQRDVSNNFRIGNREGKMSKVIAKYQEWKSKLK